jgi:hypothetical protein
VPENTTMLAKTAPQATRGSTWIERSIVMLKGETLGAILRDLGATPEEINAIIAVLGPRGRDGNLKEGQKIRVLLSPVAAPRCTTRTFRAGPSACGRYASCWSGKPRSRRSSRYPISANTSPWTWRTLPIPTSTGAPSPDFDGAT